MTKAIALLLVLLTANPAFALPGRIQNEDVKSQSDIQASAGSATGNLTSGNACITSLAFASGSAYANLATGMFIYDSTTSTNIASGVTIAGLPGSCSAGQIQMSSNAAGSGTGDTITFGGQKSQLINDTKVYLTANSINDTLSNAITAGSIGGGGGGGVQLLANPGFEIGTNGNPPSSWTITTGTGSLSTTVFYAGTQAEVVTASSQTSSIAEDVTPTQAYSSVNMESSCKVKTSLTNVQVCARVGGSDLSGCTAVPSTNTWQYVPMNFVGPASGSMGVDVKMTSSGTGSFSVDDCYVGPARNLSQVSQAQLYGKISFTGCTSGSWSTNSTTFASLGTDTGCTVTTSGNATAPSSPYSPAITFTSLPPGDVVLVMDGTLQQSSTGHEAAIQAFDGTTSSKETQGTFNSAGNIRSPLSGTYHFNYATAQSNITFSARGKTDSGGGFVLYNDAAHSFTIKVYVYPSQSQVALNSNQGPISFYASTQNPTGTIGSATNIAKFTATKDTNGAYSASTGLYTVPVESWYDVKCKLSYAVTPVVNQNNSAIIQQNATNVAGGTVVSATGLTTYQPSAAVTLYAKIGDTIGCYSWNGNTSPTYGGTGVGDGSSFSITQSNGSANGPIIVGSVTSGSSGPTRYESASIAGTGSTAWQTASVCNSGTCSTFNASTANWISFAFDGTTGNYTGTIASGTFSGIPNCTCSWSGQGADTYCEVDSAGRTLTSTFVHVHSTANGGFTISCSGPH